MIEQVVMDYDGEPVTIENGEMYDAEKPLGIWDEDREEFCYDQDRMYWDKDACDWALEPYEEPLGNDADLYGRSWFDCR